MRNLQLLILSAFCLVAVLGCASGDTPVETYQSTSAKAPDQNSYQGAIKNSNMPDAAKQGIIGKGK